MTGEVQRHGHGPARQATDLAFAVSVEHLSLIHTALNQLTCSASPLRNLTPEKLTVCLPVFVPRGHTSRKMVFCEVPPHLPQDSGRVTPTGLVMESRVHTATPAFIRDGFTLLHTQ